MEWIVPMSPILVPKVVTGKDFVHQVKWDGIRGLCYIENGAVRSFTKKGRERTSFYPELMVLPSLFKGSQAILDGEIIILNEELKPSFQLSLIRERVTDTKKVAFYQKRFPAQYIVFDLLAMNGELLTGQPLMKRRTLLKEYLKTSKSIAITDDFFDGEELFRLMGQRGWEGIVSKRIHSLYHPYKDHQDWFKTKLARKILAIVAGVTLREGNPNSLVLATQGTEGMTYVGRASIGLTQEHFRQLKEAMPALKSDQYRIKIPDMSQRAQKEIVWFHPQLTVWVSFLEWTQDGGLRHPKILGFSTSGPEEADGREFVE